MAPGEKRKPLCGVSPCPAAERVLSVRVRRARTEPRETARRCRQKHERRTRRKFPSSGHPCINTNRKNCGQTERLQLFLYDWQSLHGFVPRSQNIPFHKCASGFCLNHEKETRLQNPKRVFRP